MTRDGTVPVWLTNEGLRSTDKFLSYADTGEILRDLAKWATIFNDPLTIREKLEALDPGDAGASAPSPPPCASGVPSPTVENR